MLVPKPKLFVKLTIYFWGINPTQQQEQSNGEGGYIPCEQFFQRNNTIYLHKKILKVEKKSASSPFTTKLFERQ